MKLEQILAEFKGITYDELKERYPVSFQIVFDQQKDWLCNFEDRVSSIDDKDFADVLTKTIRKIKDASYNFEENDVVLLGNFTKKIDNVTSIGNFLNNFKQDAKMNDGSLLDLVKLFNEIKTCKTVSELEESTGGKIHAHIHNLYSVVKHCQDPLAYPFNYKFWKNISNAIFGITKNYDLLCEFYKTFPKEQRHLSFGVCMGTIATEIAKRVNDSKVIKSSEDRLYKDVTKLFHIKEYKKLIVVSFSYKEKVLLNFEDWFKEQYATTQGERLSQKSIKNYLDGIKAIDRDVEDLGIAVGGLISEENLAHAAKITDEYKHTEKFVERDRQGKNMYGRALILFLDFLAAEPSFDKILETMNNSPLNLILYGPPGTGKTYNTINKALAALGVNTDDLSRAQIKEKYDAYVNDRRIVFTTFHQSLSYEDFIEGIKPIVPASETSPIQYKIKDGIFKEIALRAKQTENKSIQIDGQKSELTKEIFRELYKSFADSLSDITEQESTVVLNTKENSKFALFRNSAGSISIRPLSGKTYMSAAPNELEAVLFDNKEPTFKSYEQPIIDRILDGQGITSEQIDTSHNNYVIIIDEINRGNVSQIFGELITLIEKDKREKTIKSVVGENETLKVTLPYSQTEFSVPDNLYIIGTMNTADRSVEALDSALRRRFVFEEMVPKPELITEIRQKKKLSEKINAVDLSRLLSTLNIRIEKLLDRDHAIGHSYFLDCKDIEDLRLTFYKNIIPLLQEYFFGDYAKLGLILGAGFVQLKEEEVVFANQFDHDGLDVFNERKVYEIVAYANQSETKAIKYSKRVINVNFEMAIKLLLNEKLEDVGE
ncbi:McrB family protein [Pedobacter nyackensis]|uniref:McrB family protein n=1 Tax=Pedobacter nyackensis TaxID=475255 RepID=UPI002931AD14|nr:AAA family ATPase [Pedobacter nyackensis]